MTIAIKPILINLNQGNPNDFMTEVDLNVVGGERVRMVVNLRTYSRSRKGGRGREKHERRETNRG